MMRVPFAAHWPPLYALWCSVVSIPLLRRPRFTWNMGTLSYIYVLYGGFDSYLFRQYILYKSNTY